MKLTEKQLLKKLAESGTRDSERYLIEYLKVTGIDKISHRLKDLDISDYCTLSKKSIEGLYFSWQKVHKNGELSITVYDILDENKPIEDPKLAHAIYELLCVLNTKSLYWGWPGRRFI